MDMRTEQLIGNRRSKQFHTIRCWWAQFLLHRKSNKSSRPVRLSSPEEAIYDGYDGCAHCLPEYHRVNEYGVLDIEQATDKLISGNYLYPHNRTSFSAKTIDSKAIEAGFTINDRSYSIRQTLDKNGVPVSQKLTGDTLVEDDEKVCIERFLISLKRYIGIKSQEAPRHLVLLGRLLLAKLHEQPNMESLSRVANRSAKNDKKCNHLNDFPILNSVKELEGRTGIVKIGELLKKIHSGSGWERYAERRDSFCLYKGEAVQAFWIGEDGVHKSTWRIVDGLYGGDNFGRAGSVDLTIGSWATNIDIFTGWNYTAADHDACQWSEHKLLGPCAREFNCAIPQFLMSPFLGCNGEDPPADMKITSAELQQGYYEYNTAHPLAGRKIGTPADWEINLDKKYWQAPPPEEVPAQVSGVKATPNPFTQKTGTSIAFSLNKEARVTIRLYHKDGFNMNMLCRSKKFTKGKHSVFWDGNNSWGLPATLGYYDAEFVVDGVARRFSHVVRKMAHADGVLPKTDVISNVKVSKNPFSIDTKTYICFDLAEEKSVSINIYHQNYTFRPINIVRTLLDNEKCKKGHHEICWDGYRNSKKLRIKAINGLYKIRILVDGKEKVINNVRKVWKV